MPEEFAETAKLFLKLQSPLSVVDGGLYLFAVSYDSSIEKQALHVFLSESGHLMEVEVTKRFSEIIPFSEDGEPGESGLKAFQTDLFKQTLIVCNGIAPLGVVVVSIVV